jgi:hypothetical protein
MTTTITKDNLHDMWIAEQVRKQDETIKMYVNAITSEILWNNKHGKKSYTKILYKEPEHVKTQVMQQLQSVFVDSNIVYSDNDGSITIDWS